MLDWLVLGMHCMAMALGGNLAIVYAITAIANPAESKPRPPRGGKRIPLTLPAGA